MRDIKNNPAGRLYLILSSLCQMHEKNTQAPMRQCLGMALYVNADDTVLLLRRIAELADLASRAEQWVRAIPDTNQNLYLSWKPAVDAALSQIALPGAQGSLAAFVGPLRQDGQRALERLHFCAEKLADHPGEKQLETVELQTLQKEVTSLRDELRDAAIDPELKLFLQYQLGMIEDAIGRYHLFGIHPLESTTQQALGAFALNPEARVRLEDTPVAAKVCDFLVRVGQQVAAGVAGNLITEVVKRLILPPA